MPKHITTTPVLSSALRIGDVVHTHGMHLRLVSGGQSKNHPSTSPVFSFVGVVLNPNEVRADGIVPWGWLIDNPDREPRWTVQGNDLCRWHIETRTAN